MKTNIPGYSTVSPWSIPLSMAPEGVGILVVLLCEDTVWAGPPPANAGRSGGPVIEQMVARRLLAPGENPNSFPANNAN